MCTWFIYIFIQTNPGSTLQYDEAAPALTHFVATAATNAVLVTATVRASMPFLPFGKAEDLSGVGNILNQTIKSKIVTNNESKLWQHTQLQLKKYFVALFCIGICFCVCTMSLLSKCNLIIDD